MNNNHKDLVEPLTTNLKWLAVFNLIVCASMVAFIFYYAQYFTIEIFQRIERGSYYVEAAKFGPALILMMPAITAFALIFFFRLINNLSKKHQLLLGKISVYSSAIALLSVVIMWPIVNYQLSKYNYSYCFFYTQSNIASPPVYVKDPQYCFMGARSVTDELFAWFDEREAAGVELTPLEVKQKIDALKEEKGTDW